MKITKPIALLFFAFLVSWIEAKDEDRCVPEVKFVVIDAITQESVSGVEFVWYETIRLSNEISVTELDVKSFNGSIKIRDVRIDHSFRFSAKGYRSASVSITENFELIIESPCDPSKPLQNPFEPEQRSVPFCPKIVVSLHPGEDPTIEIIDQELEG